jgi:hypothetical protein
MAIVEFTKDCYPYCKGDRIELSEEEQKDVDALAKQREVSNPYKVVSDVKPAEPTEEVKAVDEPEGERVKPVVSQDAAEANLRAPGVEAAIVAEGERAAKVADKKSAEKKSK